MRVDVIVGVSILSIGLCCILPVLGQVKEDARSIACQSNLRHISTAAHAYANDFDERFFYSNEKYAFMPLHGPENEPEDYQNGAWYDEARIAEYLDGEYRVLNLERGRMADGRPWRWDYGVGGGVLACPAEDESPRSYHLNGWASGSEKAGTKLEVLAQPKYGIQADPKAGGVFFDASVENASRTFLFSDVHPNLQTEDGLATSGWMTLGSVSQATRFGLDNRPLWLAFRGRLEDNRWHRSPIDFARHEAAQFLFVDGSVHGFLSDQIVDEEGNLTNQVIWSPMP